MAGCALSVVGASVMRIMNDRTDWAFGVFVCRCGPTERLCLCNSPHAFAYVVPDLRTVDLPAGFVIVDDSRLLGRFRATFSLLTRMLAGHDPDGRAAREERVS